MAHEIRAATASSSSPSFVPRGGFSFNDTDYSSERNNKNVKLLREIPLQPPPQIQCTNFQELENTSFVNVVLENGSSTDQSTSSRFFRVSDESNNELCRVVEKMNTTRRSLQDKGIKYLECHEKSGQCVMLIAYPIGLGEVALLSPTEELLGECKSNVDFLCLSLKVKYNFCDANGTRLMKMTALLRDEENERKFILMVKRSQTEKLALIRMGSLKTCCHIKFKQGQATVLERLQIIALWIGFMHNELHDVIQPTLIERQTAIKLQRKESQKKKISKEEEIVNAEVPNQQDQQPSYSSINSDDFDESSSSLPSPSSSSAQQSIKDNQSQHYKQTVSQSENAAEAAVAADVKSTMVKWKNLVKSKFSLQKSEGKYNINNNQDGSVIKAKKEDKDSKVATINTQPAVVEAAL